ncbi:uncharacterized protein HaLaN_04762 [Haematococcus lacustris]|uniref:Sulfotransferase n=1 Tax=Haematococcus lacustris TaxID=44745 RepID=A0A699YRM4_HAELA|nr:uncharacterized protein HaLaN_04762 [Haematococcus lacustris]
MRAAGLAQGMVGLVEAYWGQRGLFQGKFEDKEEARKCVTLLAHIKLHDAFLEEVQRVVPADRLLVFNVKQGWAPLCAFLGVPVPDDKIREVVLAELADAPVQQLAGVRALL